MNYTPLKNELLRMKSGQALDLLNALIKHEPQRLDAWMKRPSTIELMQISERFQTTNLYSHRTDPLPFFNDVCAIDAAGLHIKKEIR